MDDDGCQGQVVAALTVAARERTLAVQRLPRGQVLTVKRLPGRGRSCSDGCRGERTLAVQRLPREKFRLSNGCQAQVVGVPMVAGERTLTVPTVVKGHDQAVPTSWWGWAAMRERPGSGFLSLHSLWCCAFRILLGSH